MHPGAHGHSLAELLLVLSIAGLLLGLSNPSWLENLQRQDGAAVMNDLARTMAMARVAAVEQGNIVTLCASRESAGCGGSWSDGHLAFIDANGDGKLSATDRVIHQSAGTTTGGNLILRSFPNRQFVQFSMFGSTRNQNGTFTWCARDGQASSARQLIFSLSGRARLATDKDGDGVREGSNGKPLHCGN